jgi:hypothetical protein
VQVWPKTGSRQYAGKGHDSGEWMAFTTGGTPDEVKAFDASGQMAENG